MSETAFLALLLDGPLQAWGLASRFQRRNTELHPTKSGVIGLVCAAMGLAKGSPEELATLPELAKQRHALGNGARGGTLASDRIWSNRLRRSGRSI